MFVNFLLGMIALCGCISNASGIQRVYYSNTRILSKEINTIIIHNNYGDICVQSSPSNATLVSFNCSSDDIDICETNGILTIRNKQKSCFRFFNPQIINFYIYFPSSVRNMDINLRRGKVTVETQAPTLTISGGYLDILLKDMKGDMRISGGKCNVRYIGEIKTLNENVSFDISSGHLTLDALRNDF